MKIADGVEMLELSVNIMGQANKVHPVLLTGDDVLRQSYVTTVDSIPITLANALPNWPGYDLSKTNRRREVLHPASPLRLVAQVSNSFSFLLERTYF